MEKAVNFLVAEMLQNDVRNQAPCAGTVQLRLTDGTKTGPIKLEALSKCSKSEVAQYEAVPLVKQKPTEPVRFRWP